MIGELSSLAAAVCWAAAICLYGRWGHGITPWGLNLFKNAVGLAGLALLLPFVATAFPTDPYVLASLLASGLIGIALGDTAAYGALYHLGPHAAAAGLCLGPPFSALLGYWLLGESLESHEQWGIAITLAGIAGVMLSTRKLTPSHFLVVMTSKTKGIIWLTLSGLAHGGGVVLGRYGMQQTEVLVGTALRILPAEVFLLGLCAWSGHGLGVLKDERQRLRYLLVAAFLGTFVGLILMSVGLQLTKAGVSAALTSTFPIWVLPMAHFFLGQKASPLAVLSTIVACLGCAIIILGGSF